MISISEKDGATIIVIEKPSGTEQRLIEQAKKAQRILSDEVWGKFACNKKKIQESKTMGNYGSECHADVGADFYKDDPF